jgi:hypothetical protein
VCEFQQKKKRENECAGLFSSNAAGAAPSKNKKMSEAKIEREPLHTDDAPAAVGPYSQAVRVDRTIYISGKYQLF